MNHAPSWGWPALVVLGAYHGLNPGMGWLFAVALGMQEKTARAVVRSLVPIALGHAAAIGTVVLIATLIQIVVPLNYVKFAVAGMLVALGLYRIVRGRHFGWGGMQVGFRDLTIWSFLMASAHGAGLMVLPVVLGLSAADHAVTAVMALVVYEKLGLALLRKAWINLDLVWAAALIVTGCLALVV
jgi:hypothetical protein